jgi:RNA polymerase primary sigma factor
MANKYINSTEESLTKYLQEVRKTDTINVEQEVELAKRIKSGDQKAIEELVSANLRFVIRIAKDYQNSGLPLCDLISEGNYGLITAAKRFDHTKGYKFISYAVWWIRQSILQSLNENGRMVRLPANVINKLTKNKKELEKMGANFDEYDHEMNDLESEYPYVLSLSSHMNEDGDELIDVIEDTSVKSPDHDLIKEGDMKYEINQALSFLSERERNIIECYFGLNGEKMTLEMIGEEFNLTKERVRQIKEKAIRKLRYNSDKLYDFLNN